MEPREITVESVLEPEGLLARSLPGFEHRPGQVTFAAAVRDALASGSSLVAEAGTGTGKTLGYLVPAVLSRKRVVVSTATRSLQDQLFRKDVPLLRDTLGIHFEVAILKGRSNYVCLERLEHFAHEPLFANAEDATLWETFRRWLPRSDLGERTESGLPDGWSGWAGVTSTAESCLGGACPRLAECHVARARARAQEARVVIVNHALLCADLSLRARADGDLALGVLPEADAIIIDEAHALEDVATEFFGLSTSGAKLLSLARDTLEAGASLVAGAAALTAVASGLQSQADALFTEAALELGLDRAPQVALRTEHLSRTREAAAPVLETLRALVSLCHDDEPTLAALRRRSVEAASGLERILCADDPSQVYWAERRERGVTLRSAPLDAGSVLGGALSAAIPSAIYTSATLATPHVAGGDAPFDYAGRQLGLTGRPHQCLQVDSPFDFPSQAGLYVSPDLPDPRRDDWTLEFAREVYRLITLVGGRAFVLFTSLRQLQRVADLVGPHLLVPCLRQGDAPPQMLLDAFKTRPSVLFASQSFWEGVDVAGEALSLVIIDRIPFAPPDDPLNSARIEARRRSGLDPFRTLQLPRAALRLRQGFGRLIRTGSDRGVVALGDSRVLTKPYGRYLLDALPPARRLTTLAEVEAFWRGSQRSEQPVAPSAATPLDS